MKDFVPVLLVAALSFGMCFLLDRGFTKAFRSKPQHKTGRAVRLSKRYGAFGVILFALGVAAILSGIPETPILAAGGVLLLLVGIGLAVYYMTFGIFYDENTFLLTTFGKPTATYQFRQIRGQRLYNASGNLVIELYLTDGRTVQLQGGMEGVYPFLDSAFAAWLRQTGRKESDCPFHDPSQSCWFPREE